ncbi:MAG: hypothetical protein Q8O19_04005, partial [Rectinemataceae bacterium]|nr:hypothetical protein [Rectinemataceae bacterium]
IPAQVADEESLPPLLQKLVAEYSATGLPPAYIVDPLPHTPEQATTDDSTTTENNSNTNTEEQDL